MRIPIRPIAVKAHETLDARSIETLDFLGNVKVLRLDKATHWHLK
jgi:hypothetical protein